MDKDLIIRRVADVLKETPSAQDIVKKGGNRDKRFIYLATHMVNKAIENDALILAEGGLGIAILFKGNAKKKNSLKDIWEDLNLVFRVTGLKNALGILKKQKYIANQRPKEGDYLYAWFWGVVKDGRGAERHIAAEMKDKFLEISEREGLPIYAETRLRKNAVVYQRYKFENFHTWEQPGGSTMWFLRYIPESIKSK